MRHMLAIFALAFALLLSVANSAFASTKIGYFYDFSKGTLDPWTAASDAAPTPWVTGSALLSLAKEGNGNVYAALNNHGARGAWMDAKFQPTANTMLVEFDIKDAGNGKRLAPIIYAGNKQPTSVFDFQKLGMPLSETAQHLAFTVDLKANGLMNDAVLVALGTYNLDANTYDQIAGIDNISITIYDR